MKSRNIFAIITAVVGLALIVAGYLVLGNALTVKEQLLDIVVTGFFYIQLYQLVLVPLIHGQRPVSIKAGKMGRRFYGLHLCALVAILTIVLGILFPIPFKYQLLIQVVVLLFVIEGRAVLLHLGEQMVKEYQDEGLIKQGTLNPRRCFEELLGMMEDDSAMPSSAVLKMQELEPIVAEMKSSSNKVAKLLDNQIVLAQADLKEMVRKGEHNTQRLEKEISYLGMLLARRRNYKI